MKLFTFVLLFLVPLMALGKTTSNSARPSTESPILICEGQPAAGISFKFMIPKDSVATLDLKYLGQSYSCWIQLEWLAVSHGPSVFTYLVEGRRGLSCKPKLSAEMHHGLEDQLDLYIRTAGNKFVGHLTLFEGYEPSACNQLTFDRDLFAAEAKNFPSHSLRSSIATRPGKPLPALRDLIK